MLDPNKHGVFNKGDNSIMKTIRQSISRWSSLMKNTIKGLILSFVLILSSIGMYMGGEFSDIAFCIWCLTLVQIIEFAEEI